MISLGNETHDCNDDGDDNDDNEDDFHHGFGFGCK